MSFFKKIYSRIYKTLLFVQNRKAYHQIKDFKSIPIMIISYNQLFYLQQLIDFLLSKGYKNIVVIDNNSTYPPLLEYFDRMNDKIAIHRLTDNVGHLVFWKNKALFNQYADGYYIVTDADIVPIESCPEDFVSDLMEVLNETMRITKAGLSLKIDDIPDTNPNKAKIIEWESQFWKKRVGEGKYKAAIDTTFALYKPGYQYKPKRFYKAIRLDRPFQAYHGGWYIDIENLTDEQRNYIQTTNSSSSWKIDEKGNLNHDTFSEVYSKKASDADTDSK